MTGIPPPARPDTGTPSAPVLVTGGTGFVGALGLSRDGRPADEETPSALEDMVGHYKRSKYQAERVVDEWVGQGLPVVVVNPSTPVGELDVKPTPTGEMIVRFLRRRMPA